MTRREPNLIDKLAGLIPGYKGYADRETRRADDRALRGHVAARLDAAKAHVDALVRQLTAKGSLGGLDELDALERLLGRCADRTRMASEGETGLMDDVVVKADDLERVHEHDMGLDAQVKEAAAAVAALTEADVPSGIDAVRRKLQDLLDALAAREDLLHEVFD